MIDFYPYHPYFFNRRNHYALLYTAFTLGVKPDSEAVMTELEKLYLTPDGLNVLWEQNTTKGLKLSEEAVKNTLMEKIKQVLDRKLYLWAMIYIEKYQYFIVMIENEKKFNDRSRYIVKDKFHRFLKELSDWLSQKSEKKNKHKFWIISRSLAGSSQNYYIYGLSAGLYYFLDYDVNNKRLFIIKLNCISFFPEEIEVFKEGLEGMEGVKKVNTFEFKVHNNFMKGLLISELEPDIVERLIENLDGYTVYFFLQKAHRLSQHIDFINKVKSKDFPF